jgi:pantetheine-phosphate adenylyltransferase
MMRGRAPNAFAAGAPAKLAERLAMLQEAVGGLPAVKVTSVEPRFLVHWAQRVAAGFTLRGIPNVADYGHGRGMRYVNAELAAGILAVFLLPPREDAELSSSFVEGLVGPTSRLTPPPPGDYA